MSRRTKKLVMKPPIEKRANVTHRAAIRFELTRAFFFHPLLPFPFLEKLECLSGLYALWT